MLMWLSLEMTDRPGQQVRHTMLKNDVSIFIKINLNDLQNILI